MIKSTRTVFAAALLLLAAGTVHAQGAHPFIDVNVGAQTTSRTTTSTTSFTLYGEPAATGSSTTIGSGIFGEVGGGVKFGRFGIGANVSIFNRDSDATVVAQLPSPIAYSSYTNVSTTATGLRHTEVGTHVRLMYFIPFGGKAELVVFGGPSFTRVSHSAAAVSVGSGTTVTVTGNEEKGSAPGYNVGGELNYLSSARFGVGAFVRYTGGTVDLPSTPGLNVGGLQVGGGLRIRF